MIAVEHMRIARNSAEYAEILAEVFAETVQKAASDAMCSEGGKNDITPSLMECLQYVYLHGPSPIREIACGLEMSLSAGSQLVDRLVKKDLVTRRESETDRRLATIEVTASGREVVRQMRERRSKWFEAVVSGMPESRRKSFLDGLESFLGIALANEENVERACVRCGMEHVSFCVINKIKGARTDAC